MSDPSEPPTPKLPPKSQAVISAMAEGRKAGMQALNKAAHEAAKREADRIGAAGQKALQEAGEEALRNQTPITDSIQ